MPGVNIPEIKWKVFRERSTQIAHVAPAIENRLMQGHTLSEKCPCSVTIEKSQFILIIIHHVIH